MGILHLDPQQFAVSQEEGWKDLEKVSQFSGCFGSFVLFLTSEQGVHFLI